MLTSELIPQLIAKKARWSASDNPISVLDETTRRRMLGREQPTALPLTAEAPMAGAGAITFDPLVDWRNRNGRNYVTPVKDQVSCGSCVSFGTVGVVESMAIIEKNLVFDLSEADQHFCSSHGASCGGWNDASAFDQIKSRGVCVEASFPYATAFPNNDPTYYWSHAEPPHPTCRISPDRDSWVVKISNILNFGTNLQAIKNHLSNVGPVSTSFAVYTDFFSYNSGVYHKVSGNLEGYHCVMIVGYSEAEGCWICKNSWNNSWGMGGFFKIAYGECQIDSFTKIGVTGVVVSNPKREFNKVTLGDTSNFAPSICLHNGKVFIAWTGVGNNKINIMSSADGRAFANKATLGDTATGSPSITSFNGLLYLAWTGTDGRHSLNVMSSANGTSFANKVTLGDTSFTAPSIAAFKGKLYLSWTGNDARHSLNVMSSADGRSFANKVTLADTSFATPAIVALGNFLYLAWSGNDAAHSLNLLSSSDGISFINKRTYGETSGSGPSLSNDGNLVWISWTGTGNLKVNFMTYPAQWAKLTLGETAVGTTAIAYPYFAWTGTDAQHHLNVAKLG
jgi:C1A family cysteine protease